MRRAVVSLVLLLAAGIAGWLSTRLSPALVAGLIVLAGGVVVLSGPLDHWGDWHYHYHRYLRSRRWSRLRAEVLPRDAWTCQDCRRAHGYLVVHHRRYRPWWWYWLRLPERQRDLVSLCRPCHAVRHDKED